MSHVSVHALSDLTTSNAPSGGPYSACPTCGDPYLTGPGCHTGRCAATCGDVDHNPGDCTDRCYNPHLYY